MAHTVSDSFDDLREDFQAPDGTVDLAARMVGHDDAVAPVLERLRRVRGALYALDHERAAARDLLPLAAEPADLLPGVRLAVPDAAVDPLALVAREVGLVLRHEHRVGLAQLVSGRAGVVEPVPPGLVSMHAMG